MSALFIIKNLHTNSLLLPRCLLRSFKPSIPSSLAIRLLSSAVDLKKNHSGFFTYNQRIKVDGFKAFQFPLCRSFSSECHLPAQMDPVDKVAIITGGETGIGLAAAKSLLENGVKTVVLAGVCEGESVVKAVNEEFGEGSACFMHMDVNTTRDFEELFYRVDTVFGGVDIVFNNAGILQDHVWDYEIDVNLKSAIRGTLLGLSYMGKEGRGRKRGGLIINHADTAALDALPYAPAYVATKAGIIYATLSFGSQVHYNSSGVRVVGLITGPTDTALLHDCVEKQLEPAWGKATLAALTQTPPQSPAVVGRGVTHLVKFAPPGSLWTLEKGTLSITEFGHWRSHNTFVTQL